MQRFISSVIFTVSLFCSLSAQNKGVRINEILQSNVYQVDENMYLPDGWIELYNDSDEDIDLNGWRIVEWIDDANMYSHTLIKSQFLPMGEPSWRVPATTIIPAKGYAMIYCDAECWGMHTFYKLSSEANHNLALYDSRDNLIDEVLNIPELLYPDVSYGRVEGSDTLFSHFSFSTPKAPNKGEAKDVAPKVSFSETGGVFSSGFSVELSTKVDSLNEHIYYTLDGSEPTFLSEKYSEPIEVDSTTILRARVLKEGLIPRNTQTQSYLIPDHDIDLPVMSLVTDSLWLFDDSLGIYEGNKTEVNVAWGIKGNFGGNRYRYASVEYFDDLNDGSKLNQQILIRLGGGATRTYPQKSVIFKANKRLPKSSFKYPLWKEKPQITKTKSFVLRNSGNDCSRTMFRDAAVQHLLGGKVDLDILAYQPCVLYVNGEYYGIYNIRERSNDTWVDDNTDLDDDEYDAVENYNQVKAGTNKDFLDLLEQIEDSTITYDEIISQFESEELMNYIILQMFSGNMDWPQNNVFMWRKKNGGKWRFLCKDLDYLVGLADNLQADAPMFGFLYNKPTLQKPYSNLAESMWDEYKSRLIRYFLSQEQFVEPFLEKSILYLGTYLNRDSVSAVIDSFSYGIENEMYYHRDRWEGDDWYHSVDFLREQLGNRADYSYEHITEHYDLGDVVPARIEGEDESNIQLYDMPIPGAKFDGSLFSGKPARLKCSPEYRWRVEYNGLDGEEYSYTLPDSTTFVALPSYKNLSLTAENIKSGLKETNSLPECEWWVSNGTLFLRAINEPLQFVELLSVDGKSLWRGENVEELKLPLSKCQMTLLKYQSATKFGTYKVMY